MFQIQEAKPSAQLPPTNPGTPKPALALPLRPSVVKDAERGLTELGIDFDSGASRDLKTDRLFFLSGEIHDDRYRSEAAKTFRKLVEKADVRAIGFEGLFGSARKEILDDRIALLSGIVGKVEMLNREQGERDLFRHVSEFIEQKVKTQDGTGTVAAFGLEDKKALAQAMCITEQQETLVAMLTRVNEVNRANRKLGVADILGPGGDAFAIDREQKLLRMNENIASNPELRELIPRDFPRYSRELTKSAAALLDYQRKLLTLQSELLVEKRDESSARALETHAPKAGNTIFNMGWIHLPKVSQSATASTIVIHPVAPDSKIRAELDPKIKAVLEHSRKMETYSFFSGGEKGK